MFSRKLAITGTVAACAACCAPLVVPVVWPVLIAAGLVGTGGAGGGWLAGLSPMSSCAAASPLPRWLAVPSGCGNETDACRRRFRTFPKGRNATLNPAGPRKSECLS